VSSRSYALAKRPSEAEELINSNSDEHDRISRHDCSATTTALAV
jgi:hypothetical protein